MLIFSKIKFIERIAFQIYLKLKTKKYLLVLN